MENIQSSATRLLTRCRICDHITPVLYKLHWLPTPQRIHLKLLHLTYVAPALLKNPKPHIPGGGTGLSPPAPTLWISLSNTTWHFSLLSTLKKKEEEEKSRKSFNFQPLTTHFSSSLIIIINIIDLIIYALSIKLL